MSSQVSADKDWSKNHFLSRNIVIFIPQKIGSCGEYLEICNLIFPLSYVMIDSWLSLNWGNKFGSFNLHIK